MSAACSCNSVSSMTLLDWHRLALSQLYSNHSERFPGAFASPALPPAVHWCHYCICASPRVALACTQYLARVGFSSRGTTQTA
eukprot:3948774-Alexandrium_andersonii.AAC.1